MEFLVVSRIAEMAGVKAVDVNKVFERAGLIHKTAEGWSLSRDHENLGNQVEAGVRYEGSYVEWNFRELERVLDEVLEKAMLAVDAEWSKRLSRPFFMRKAKQVLLSGKSDYMDVYGVLGLSMDQVEKTQSRIHELAAIVVTIAKLKLLKFDDFEIDESNELRSLDQI